MKLQELQEDLPSPIKYTQKCCGNIALSLEIIFHKANTDFQKMS